ALRKLGELALAEPDGPRAAALFAQSLTLYRELGPDDLGLASAGIAGCLAGSGEVAVAAGSPERGARLLAAAQALLEARGVRLTPSCQAVYGRSVAAARAALGEAGAGGAEGGGTHEVGRWGPGMSERSERGRRFGREADSAGSRAPGFAAAWAEGQAMAPEQ